MTSHGHRAGLQPTKEYRTWTGMKTRCHNPNDPGYQKYGAKGIEVCPRWRESFAHFLADIGPSPSPRYTIDRLNSSLGYNPTNCRWATYKQQAFNRKSTIVIAHAGEEKCLTEWAMQYQIAPKTAWRRYQRGLPFDAIFQATP